MLRPAPAKSKPIDAPAKLFGGRKADYPRGGGRA